MADFLNREQVKASLVDVLSDAECEVDSFEDEVDEYAEMLADSIISDMDAYVHKSDTKIWGNLANIRTDWNICKNFVSSNIEPWGDFDEVVKSIDNETISDEDLDKFHQWALDWFYTAFGTYGIRYNFEKYLLNID